MRFDRTHIALLFVVLTPMSVLGESGYQIEATVRTFLTRHCNDCHSGEEPTGGLAMPELSSALKDAETIRRWGRVFHRIASGEMPPPSADQPSQADRKAAVASLEQILHRADSARRSVVLRRLNRQEYQNTVRDLFDIDATIHGLPQDNPTDGFDNVGEGLAVSAEAMQAYLQAADQVLDAVFGPAKEPKRIRHETNLLKQVDWKGRPQLANQMGKMFRQTDDGLVIFQSGYCPTNLVNFARLRAPAGTYRGTIRARAIQSDRPVTLRIYAGDTIVNRREQHLVGYYDVPTEWTTIEFTDRLVEPGGTFLPKCYNTRDTRKDADTYPEPGIELGDIVIEGPLEPWPPKSRAKLLGSIDVQTAGAPEAEAVLRRLLPFAFRRTVEPDAVEPFLKLFRDAFAQGRTFESSLRVSLKAILCSPHFLFLDEPMSSAREEISPFALANRLSYFLWSSMPDAELLSLARSGRLADPKILAAQAERMLKSSKSHAFVKNFTGQWLHLREIKFTEPDANLYPEFDELLRISMVRETELFFTELLHQDLSIVRFVDADFAFLNERLAKHYGIDDVEGQSFRRVELAPDSLRGGLLGQASLLKVTANGTYTSPVLRGVWLLENLIGDPTPPPPDNVGSVEPDTRGATTIRDQLERHRASDSCAVCHRRIDPPGFALECFDPIGGFRTRYRTTSDRGERPNLKQAPFTFQWVRYRLGANVDNSLDVTREATPDAPTGEALAANVRRFRTQLASQPDSLARTLATKLMTYSMGRSVGFSDRKTLDQIVTQSRKTEYGLRSLVHAVIQNPSFRKP